MFCFIGLKISRFSYRPRDFSLSDGLRIESVSVSSDGVPDNNLITYLEDSKVRMAMHSSISYRRLNFKEFQFNIQLSNPQSSSKKVIVRIFLGLQKNSTIEGNVWYNSKQINQVQNDPIFRHFEPKEAIELDRFVHRLMGDTRELITRHSNQVVSTMKQEHGMTVNRSGWREKEDDILI